MAIEISRLVSKVFASKIAQKREKAEEETWKRDEVVVLRP
jgi:hypothetical protein